MSERVLYVVFDDEQDLLKGAGKLVDKGVHVSDVYSPFPIHGLEKVIGLPRTRLAIMAFIYGAIGVSLAFIAMNYFMIEDWPMNIGGKPSFGFWKNMPSFVPIGFEFMVMCAAHGMAITYLIRNWTLPGVEARNPDPRSTDDKFIMEFKESECHGSFDEIQNTCKESGASEFNEEEIAE